MLTLIKQEAKATKYILYMVGLFIVFLGLYVFLDFEGNTNYTLMTQEFGATIVTIHIAINIAIAILTARMVLFSIINYNVNKSEPVGSNAIPFFTWIFGLLTFGCTGCVVAFFTAVGIGFTPIILPAGNMLWKVIALIFVIAGYIWIMYSINNSKCKIKKAK
jgi:hypothetical protein